jgi:hypothetical protein
VYQLKDSKFRNTSICLFTDYKSGVNVSKSTDPELFIFETTALDMRSMDSKSNGAVAWSNKIDFECSGVFKENASYPSSGQCCPKTFASCLLSSGEAWFCPELRSMMSKSCSGWCSQLH